MQLCPSIRLSSCGVIHEYSADLWGESQYFKNYLKLLVGDIGLF